MGRWSRGEDKQGSIGVKNQGGDANATWGRVSENVMQIDLVAWGDIPFRLEIDFRWFRWFFTVFQPVLGPNSLVSLVFYGVSASFRPKFVGFVGFFTVFQQV